jgi:hypothetical protein
LGVTAEAVELADGVARVKAAGGTAGGERRAVPLGELAVAANPLRGAVAPDTEPGLEATRYFGPQRGATARRRQRPDSPAWRAPRKQ